MPLSVLLRNRLKYALTYKEVKMIGMQRLVKVDAKVRTDMNFPTGFMDVVTLEKTNQHFRMLSAPLREGCSPEIQALWGRREKCPSSSTLQLTLHQVRHEGPLSLT